MKEFRMKLQNIDENNYKFNKLQDDQGKKTIKISKSLEKEGFRYVGITVSTDWMGKAVEWETWQKAGPPAEQVTADEWESQRLARNWHGPSVFTLKGDS